MKKIGVLFLLLNISFSGFSQDWLVSWKNRIEFSIQNFNYEPLVDYQVRLKIGYQEGMASDYRDVRFTDSTSVDTLSYWIEYSDVDSVVVWVKIDSIPAFESGNYYLYYCNSDANAASDPYATFIFFDDFEEDEGWNDIGTITTQITTLEDTITTLNKYDDCELSGAWKEIGDTISNFKLITKDFMPANTNDECTAIEYGIETANSVGFNLIREGNSADEGYFGLQKRTGPFTSGVSTTLIDQPSGNWYYTTLSYCHICQFNLHATLHNDNMEALGEVYHYSYATFDFSKFTIRGGYNYHLDYIAVAQNQCIDPQISMSESVESCPVGELISFEDDLCNEGLGEITFQVTGGSVPYSIIMYNGLDSLSEFVMDTSGILTIDSLFAGEYLFQIIDDAGCEN